MDQRNRPDSDERIDPEDLETALRVIRELDQLPVEHPDSIIVQQAAAGLYKSVKIRRRQEKRRQVLEHDAEITARTATAAPGRIDDETAGLPLVSNAKGATAGTLIEARACYICKQPFREVDAFYHQLCPDCAAFNHARRDARTDLTGKRALLTGGRAKIGMYIALRLLRDGADTTITTRFPNDAVRRFRAMEDSEEWFDRLHIVGIDLRDPGQVVDLADSIAARGPLDVLINNACQTVRRTPDAYGPLIRAELEELEPGPVPDIETFARHGEHHLEPAHLEEDNPRRVGDPAGKPENRPTADPASHWAPTPHAIAAMALIAGSADLDLVDSGRAIDAGGLVPDVVDTNSWVQRVNEVDPIELLEVQLCNMTAPFILISRLRHAMANSPARRTYVVNVSAMEGQFSRGYKGPGHPHTNMAKAALNMLTRTSAREMLENDGILMTAVDTGWITDERPHTMKKRLADDGFHAPLDLVDGAARVYDPIIRGEQGEDIHGVFLKDYKPSPW
ncbi:MAG: SDR family NAD(P)-dependent oxidoreductase [Solirubrobacterales bacterium]|nr:SDR family NAD(P)-dependent oxidoreductase [Solirubrobacterales bacterium]MCB8916210.1 SDR family NAD(P)-dependent oxidoreductase [Thermoleophilales bacterium]